MDEWIGKVLRSPRTSMTFVPFEPAGRTSYNVVVVDSGPSPECQHSYPVGGYNLCVSIAELTECLRVGVPTA